MSSATTGEVAIRSSIARVGPSSLALVAPLVLPGALLVVGACIGDAFTLDQAVARERLAGLGLAALLGVCSALALRAVERTTPLLLCTASLAVAAGVWVISTSGSDVFRGLVGSALQVVFRPVFGLTQLTEPVDLTNTRFIVGYNGLADLCLVCIFCCLGVCWRRQGAPSGAASPRGVPNAADAPFAVPTDASAGGGRDLPAADTSAQAALAARANPAAASSTAVRTAHVAATSTSAEAVTAASPNQPAPSRNQPAPAASSTTRAASPGTLAASLAVVLALGALLLLVGTGARGGLTGLAAGLCAIGLFAWPRRYALVAAVAAPLAVIVAAAGVLDKGLEFSSTAGRLTYWGDLARLLVEYPLTGVGLGVDTANRVTLQYEINPDPERIFYAHNTFVQAYLEQGPLGALGMLSVPLIAIAAALIARRWAVAESRRPLLIAGLGIVGGLEAHGLTDQVVTTNVGTAFALVGLAAIVAALSSPAQQVLARGLTRASLAILGLAALALVAMLIVPAGRAQALLDLGSLRLNQALALDSQAPERAPLLAQAEGTLDQALALDPTHPAVLRELARTRAARFEDDSAADALRQAAASSRLDAFDRLQIAHLYRDLGSPLEAYAWAAQAYADWGRPPEDAVMQVYAQSTLTDDRARTLATQAEAAMRARTFGQAQSLFQQALTFEPTNAYLLDRIGAAQRAVERYGAAPQAQGTATPS